MIRVYLYRDGFVSHSLAVHSLIRFSTSLYGAEAATVHTRSNTVTADEINACVRLPAKIYLRCKLTVLLNIVRRLSIRRRRNVREAFCRLFLFFAVFRSCARAFCLEARRLQRARPRSEFLLNKTHRLTRKISALRKSCELRGFICQQFYTVCPFFIPTNSKFPLN